MTAPVAGWRYPHARASFRALSTTAHHAMMKLLCVALLAVVCTCFSPASTTARSRSVHFSISRGSETGGPASPQRPAIRSAPVPSAILAAMLAASMLTSPIAARADNCAIDCMKECTALAPGAANQAYCTSQCDGFCGGASSSAKEVRFAASLGRRLSDTRAPHSKWAKPPSAKAWLRIRRECLATSSTSRR